jgi:hypothetical protein
MLQVSVYKDRGGVTFSVHPYSRGDVVKGTPPRVYVAFDENFGYEHLGDLRWRVVADILTGKPGCDVDFVDSVTDEVLKCLRGVSTSVVP